MKILLFTQHIFPLQTPRAFRSWELILELCKQGHDVHVYAVLGKNDYSDILSKYPNLHLNTIPLNFTVVPFTSDGFPKRPLIDKVLGKLLGKYFAFPIIEFVKRIPQIISKGVQYDALISIADPHPIHWGCALAKEKFPQHFPKVWIADCGDPFMYNDTTKEYPKYFSYFEKKFSALCDFITVPVKEAVLAYYPEYRSKIKVIPQGFDFELNTIIPQPKNAIPHFAYAGMFYPDIRNPKQFLQCLLEISTPFVFHIYTPYTNLIQEYIEEFGNKIQIHKTIPRQELLEVLKQMDFVVNLENSNSPNQLPSKLIDYAIAQKPILSIQPQNPNRSNIKAFLAGDYQDALIVPDTERFHITHVAKNFIHLIQTTSV